MKSKKVKVTLTLTRQRLYFFQPRFGCLMLSVILPYSQDVSYLTVHQSSTLVYQGTFRMTHLCGGIFFRGTKYRTRRRKENPQ